MKNFLTDPLYKDFPCFQIYYHAYCKICCSDINFYPKIGEIIAVLLIIS